MLFTSRTFKSVEVEIACDSASARSSIYDFTIKISFLSKHLNWFLQLTKNSFKKIDVMKELILISRNSHRSFVSLKTFFFQLRYFVRLRNHTAENFNEFSQKKKYIYIRIYILLFAAIAFAFAAIINVFSNMLRYVCISPTNKPMYPVYGPQTANHEVDASRFIPIEWRGFEIYRSLILVRRRIDNCEKNLNRVAFEVYFLVSTGFVGLLQLFESVTATLSIYNSRIENQLAYIRVDLKSTNVQFNRINIVEDNSIIFRLKERAAKLLRNNVAFSIV